MGILEQIQSDQAVTKIDLPKKSNDDQNVPTKPCPRPECLGSRQWWLDAYGTWHCGCHDLPAALACVRRVYTMPDDQDVVQVGDRVWVRRKRVHDGWEDESESSRIVDWEDCKEPIDGIPPFRKTETSTKTKTKVAVVG